jgi:hypothetical protein
MNMKPGQFPDDEFLVPVQTNETTREYGYFPGVGLWQNTMTGVEETKVV